MISASDHEHSREYLSIAELLFQKIERWPANFFPVCDVIEVDVKTIANISPDFFKKRQNSAMF